MNGHMRMLFLFLLACLASLLVVSCGVFNGPIAGAYQYTDHAGSRGIHPVRVINIWIDKDFGEADKLSISDAIGQWNFVLNGYVILNVVDTQFDMEPSKIVTQVRENGWLFMRVNSKDSSFIPTIKEAGYYCIGFTERVGGNHLYLVRDRLANEEVQGVTMHEIGHLLGSPHIGDRLMSPHYQRNGWQCIDYATVQKVAEWQEIPVEKLNYCRDMIPDVKKKP